MRMKRSLAAALIAAATTAASFAAEPATVTVSKIKDLSIRMYGFVELDAINDSRQGFTEEEGNTPVQRSVTSGGADIFAGKHNRQILSVRNSRLGFDLTLPKTEGGWLTEGIIELDFLGNNGTNAVPGSAPGAQTERDFFNNPAVRVRHAYTNLTNGEFNAKLGQYWSLLGWQPYYFPSEVIVQPGVGQLYRRFPQARVTYGHAMGDWLFEAAADAAKPAEMNSGLTEFHGGLRLSSTKTKAATTAGAGANMVGLSAAVSGAYIPVRTDAGNDNGGAIAFDVFIPLIASKDGTDRSNNLSLSAEYMAGSGVGGLEYSGLTLGVPGVVSSTHTGTALDSGIAGLNNDGNVELIRVQAERINLSYTLPNPKWSLSLGYAEVDAKNLSSFSSSLYNSNGGGVGFTPKKQFGYLALFCDPLPYFRVAAEYNQTIDTYNDTLNRTAINHRYQLSTFFTF